MECACGIHYSDDPTHWEGLLHDNGPKNAMSRYTAVYVSTCPRCATPGIKIFDFPQNISDPLNPDNPNTYISAGKIQDARTVFPTIYRSTRTAIPLDGVPAPIQDTYRKALTALDSPTLYEYAVILARRSLETSLRRLGYSGRDLANLVDSLLADQGNGFPNRLLENIDAIRNLGNIEAHEITAEHDDPLAVSKAEADWCISIWERFLTHCYVEPAQDALFQQRLNDELQSAGRPPLKQPPNPT